ncbi:autophagy protein Apg17-domain-containing protein [Ephemerocybe angulata]|uniref:Autophagy-related protein 17 n=1 Tax=Ephemerocybe angulata TaxID=980116 RepID=A0A8H6I4C9_9AGAR|nr:autophagy protein Apg17-domain-containing protein [Tulosesus angulatus]
MSHPAPSEPTEQPHLVSLVLQSKKALQHGEQLCSRAQSQYNTSAQEAIEVLALDAKVRWIAEAIGEQLKLAAGVAKAIEEKRAALAKQVKSWDTSRTKHTDSLESILESLGGQVVPPDFYETSAASSLFGSQHSDDDEDQPFGISEPRRQNGHPMSPPVSPSATLRRPSGSFGDKGKGKAKNTLLQERRKIAKADRSKWKTLRDFVDDRAIEDILETIENDRNTLEDILNQTVDYPPSLRNTIASLRDSLPTPPQVPILTQMQDALIAQDTTIASMAEKLESLAGHYDEMAGALKDTEAGEAFSDEDMQAMNRDTEELPIIMSELDDCAKQIEGQFNRLVNSRKSSQQDLDHLLHVLNDLEELGDIMSEMLLTQDSVEIKCEEALTSLQQRLETLDHLHERYVLYQTAFNKLMLEMARRRHYKDATENIVNGMISQLEAMSEEESQLRKHFNAECGAHLPEDICLSIGNEPTRWDVLPWPGDAREILPEIDADLIVEARERLQGHSDIVVGPESL